MGSNIPICTKAKQFLKVVEEQFVSSDKVLASTLMKRLSSKTFDNTKNVCELMEMRDMAAQFKLLTVEISESFLVHLMLNSFLITYEGEIET